jgi:phosphatidylglycerol:prolipoprotein diacylglycerol transferase
MSLSAFFYGLAYATGLAAFIWMARRRGLATTGIWTIMQAGLIGGLVGANLCQWVFGGTAGKTVLGGIAGGYLAVHLCKWHMGLRRPTGDLFAVALCAGEAIGRLGCFYGGCCYGKRTTLPWAVWQHGAWRHPSQIYLSLSCLFILGMLWLYSRSNPLENGLFYLQGLLYCLARFIVEFYRDGAPVFAGLTTAQLACIGGGVFFGVRLWQLSLSKAHNSPAPSFQSQVSKGT